MIKSKYSPIDAKISINAGFTVESKYLGKPSKEKNKK